MLTRTTVLPVSSGVPLLVAAGVLWGTGGLLGALLAGATALHPLAVAGYRLGGGGVLLLALLIAARRPVPRSRAAWRRIAVTAVLAAEFQACYFAAVALTSVSLATLVTIGAVPVLVLAADLVRGRPASRRTTVACVFAVFGLGLLVGWPAPGAGAVTTGTGLALLSAAGFAAMTLLGSRPVEGLDVDTTTGVAFTLGGAVLLAAACAAGGIGFTPTAGAVALLVTFAVVPTALAYTLYFRGLATAPASVGAVVALLEPLTGALLAALLLGDRLGGPGLVGAAVLGAAVVLASTAGPGRDGMCAVSGGRAARGGARRTPGRRATDVWPPPR